MLHDPSHREAAPVAEPIKLTSRERDILRKLGEKITDFSMHPSNREKALLWRDLNDLKSQKPMVWINEIPWHEMDVYGELKLKTKHPPCPGYER